MTGLGLVSHSRSAEVNQFNQPFFLSTVEQAKRLFITQVNQDPTQSIYHHAEQFNLYHLGQWDMDNGIFIPLDVPAHLSKASDVKDPQVLERHQLDNRIDQALDSIVNTDDFMSRLSAKVDTYMDRMETMFTVIDNNTSVGDE